MRILFEQHQYDAHHLDGILQDIITGVELDFTKKAKVNFVGYFYCAPINDCVFILPKVLLCDLKDKDGNLVKDKEGKVIEVLSNVTTDKKEDGVTYVTPEDIITHEGQKRYLKDDYRKFIYEFSVWIYRCLFMYRRLNPKEESIYFKQLPQAGGGRKHEARTFLDIILSLIRFNQENQNFFMFIIKNQHSGMNKINWTKTISRSSAFVQDETPIYLDVVNKKRRINFDEELLVIFFSILNHLNEQYGFKVPLNCNYELITGKKFESFAKGIGLKRLRQIKYKYFSDKAIELWHLCYAFFDNTHALNVSTEQKEYLLSRNFEHVFEAMIDELIGAPRTEIPKGLKDQEDGKRVDHMYSYKSLTSHNDETNEEIYYIGDSKYYKSGHKLTSDSVGKQYTYARNVIQWNIDLWMNNRPNYWTDENEENYRVDKASRFGKIKLRKDTDNEVTTEGYNVIPNFFLSAFVDDERRYNANKDNIRLHTNKDGEHSTYIRYQFENRLFDRDTLILSHYDVNFLYVIYLYARNKSSEKTSWKEEVRKIFRDEIRNVLEKKYDFYAMKPRTERLDVEYIKAHFQDVLGKIYTPYSYPNIYSLALNKSPEYSKQNEELKDALKEYFIGLDKKIEHLGDLPEEIINYVPKAQMSTADVNKLVLVGCVKSEEQLRWIFERGYYNIPLEGHTSRRGAVELNREYLNADLVLLYKYYNVGEEVSFIGLYNLANDNSIPDIISKKKMSVLPQYADYPFAKDADDNNQYLMYEIDVDNEETVAENLNGWLNELVGKQVVKGKAEVLKMGDIGKQEN